MITEGIDIGGVSSRAAIMKDSELPGTRLIQTGHFALLSGNKVFEDLLPPLEIKKTSIKRIIATGYGRKSVIYEGKTMTEIACHEAGAYYFSTRSEHSSISEDSKAIVTDKRVKIMSIVMNEKFAEGTGKISWYLPAYAGRIH